MFRNWFAKLALIRMRRAAARRGRPVRRIRWVPRFESLESRETPAAVTVDTLSDILDGTTTSISDLVASPGADGQISLREAVEAANNTTGADAITFDPTLTAGGPATIALSLGQLSLTDTAMTTIEGPRAELLAVSGGGASRVFLIDTGSNATLTGMTIRDGQSDQGAGIFSRGTLTVSGCIVAQNTATASFYSLAGAGIFVDGTTLNVFGSTISNNTGSSAAGVGALPGSQLVISGSVISNNTAANGGAGLYLGSATAIVTDTTFSGNVTPYASYLGGGGAIKNDDHSQLTLVRVTLSNNSSASYGGGVFSIHNSIVTATNSTIANNTAGWYGGGIATVWSSPVTLNNSTVVSNTVTSGTGGGVYAEGGSSAAFSNTLVASNSASSGPDFSGAATSQGHNLIATSAGSTGWVGTDLLDVAPLLGTLADNGGPTQTMALLAGSPALDAGDDALAAGLTTDQRGVPFTRAAGAHIDIGAYESQNLYLVVDITADESDGNYAVGDLSLREAVELANLNPGTDTITLDPTLTAGGPATIALSLGQLSLTDTALTTVAGPGAGLLAVSGGGASRVLHIGSGADVSLSGMTIRDGQADQGAGIYVTGSLTLDSCVISNNTADTSGGGIQIENGASGALTNCTINENASTHAGGVLVLIGSISIHDSIISNNTAVTDGGGVYLYLSTGTIAYSMITGNTAMGEGGGAIKNDDHSQLTLDHVTLSGNSSDIGGGVFSTHNSILTITSSDILQNEATSSGGGIAVLGGSLSITGGLVSQNVSEHGGGILVGGGTLAITGASISGNQATTDGAGLYVSNSTGTVTQTTLTDNIASNTGSGIPGGGAIKNDTNSDLTLVNTTVANNQSATEGGGIENWDSTLTLLNTTVADNTAATSGGGINNVFGTIYLSNSLIAGNTASTGADVAAVITSNGHNLISDTAGNSGWVGTDLLDVDPLLGPLASNGGPTQTMALLAGSPALDAGDDVLAAGLTTDQRRVPFSRTVGAHVDIGAYESQSLNLVVDITADESDGNYAVGDLSLREAVELANLNPGGDAIAFDPALTAGGPATITLTLGQLTLADSALTTITGPGAVLLTVSGGGSSRIVQVEAGAAGELSGLTIADGTANSGGGARNYGTLTVETSVFQGNSATGDGGGIYNTGTLTLDAVQITGNQGDHGGAVFNQSGAVTITASTLSENTAGIGGAVSNWYGGMVIVSTSTLSGNTAGLGGAVDNYYSATISFANSTIANNSATSDGGAIRNDYKGSVSLTQTTVSGNSAVDRCGGILDWSGYPISIQNSLIANNTSSRWGPDVYGTIVSQGHNLIGNSSDSTGWVGTDLLDIEPLLASLADNGGPTQTIALLPTSPALDAGDPANTSADQRGVPVQRGRRDIGAFEYMNVGPGAASLSGATVPENASAGTSTGTLSAIDPEGDALSFELIAGTGDDDNALFEVDGDQLLALQPFDFEVRDTYSVRVRAADAFGGSSESVLTVTVTDVNEAPSVSLTNVVASLIENSDTTSPIKIADIVITDDALGSNELTLSGADVGSFEILGSALYLKAGTTLDYESQTSYAVTVEVDDSSVGATPDDSEAVSLAVTDVYEGPVITSDGGGATASITAPENGTPVTTVTATLNAGKTATFSLTGGADAGLFSIDSGSGVLTFTAPHDFENPDDADLDGVYEVTIQVSDGTLTDSQDLDVTVTDENEIPEGIALDNDTVAENGEAEDIVGYFAAFDPDGGQSFTYSLVSGTGDADNAEFAITGGILRTSVSLDYEATPEHTRSILVRATDQGGLFFDQEFTITVTDVNDAPNTLALTNSSIAENAGSNAPVGSVIATDPDAGDTVTLSLAAGVTDNDLFTLTGGNLYANDSFDFETQSGYTVVLTATDTSGVATEATLAITVSDVNEAPTAVTLDTVSLAENAGTLALVGNLGGSDPDAGDSLAFSLASGVTDNNLFTVSGGQLFANDSFDFETGNSFTVTVTATDLNGLTRDQEFTITITDVNEAPTSIELSNNSISENAGVHAVIGTLSGTDPDVGDSLAFSLGTGGDEAAFEIVGDQLKALASFDYETQTSYSITVIATDTGSLTRGQMFVIFVLPVNEFAPTDIVLSNSVVAENSGPNTIVGSLTATDADAGDTHTFSIVAGLNGAAFSISGSSLIANNNWNFEAKPSYAVKVRTTDAGGLTCDETFTISVTDVNEAPTGLTFSKTSIAENQPANTRVALLSAFDPDSTPQTFTYSLVGGIGSADNGSFRITGAQLFAVPSFNYEAKKSYTIRIRATDQGGLPFEKAVTINVTNVNEAPTSITLSKSTIAENNAVDAIVGVLTAVDPDVGDTGTFTLVPGTGDTDNAAFAIVGNQLLARSSFNYEGQKNYSVRVRDTDIGGLTFEKVLAVTVTNVNEAATDLFLTSTSVNENAGVNKVIGTLSHNDPDAYTVAHTWALVAGPGDTDNAAFNFYFNQLRANASFNFEVKNSYSVRVRTTDPFGLSFEKAFTITVNDVNEAPTNLTLSSLTVPRVSVAGTVVGTLLAVDPDVSMQTFSFTKVTGTGSIDNAKFSVVGMQLELSNAINVPAGTTFSIRLRVTDQDGLFFEKIFVITTT